MSNIFVDTSSEAAFVEQIRATFRSYVPESDAWAKPNFFDINATVQGGLAWSAVNEARNGIDARFNPQTVVGEALDILVAQPPLFLTRYGATFAKGQVKVTGLNQNTVDIGFEFKTADGVTYINQELVAVENGEAILNVVSEVQGSNQNSIVNRPLEFNADGVAISLGIFGGSDVECDEQLRKRLYSGRESFHFFGSACSMENLVSGAQGVSRAWAVEDGAIAKIMFLKEGTNPPCGAPTQQDILDVEAYVNEACKTPMFFCPVFCGANTIVISPEISWTSQPDDICAIQEAMQNWLRANFGLGDGVRATEIEEFLNNNYPQYGGRIKSCCDYEPVCGSVYNCVELLGC